jgi:predicted MFS family arabinose efflux permease
MVLLILAVLLLPAYFLWAARQERGSRPILIPNSWWKNPTFTAICLNVFLMWAAFNGVEQLLNFIFQRVRHLSSTTAALQFLPSPVAGTIASAVIGCLIHRYRADCIIIGATIMSCAPPLLLAVSNVQLPYWAEEFPSVILNSTGADALFIISNLLITSMFVHEKQGLAGGVFNTVAQIGRSSGIMIVGLVSDSITASSSPGDRSSPGALMKGYRAASWLCLALNVAVIGIVAWRLRRVGKVGL